MSAHTPGPWAVNPVNAQVDAMPSTLPVCKLLWPTKKRSEAETFANANLISAAPELLAALIDAVEYLQHHMPEVDVESHRAAIAKANGATP